LKDVLTSHGKLLFCHSHGNSVVAQQRCKITQQLSGSENVAAFVGLKDCLIGESSATISSSEASKFFTFAKDLCKLSVFADIQLFKTNGPEVTNTHMRQREENTV
jgi:hypothetical protein